MKWQSTLPSNVFGIYTLLIADRPAFCWRTWRVVRDRHLCWAQGMDVTLVLSSLTRMFTGAGQVLQPTGNMWASVCVCVCVRAYTCACLGSPRRETQRDRAGWQDCLLGLGPDICGKAFPSRPPWEGLYASHKLFCFTDHPVLTPQQWLYKAERKTPGCQRLGAISKAHGD